MSAQAAFRIMKELKEFQEHPDTNLYVALTAMHVCQLTGKRYIMTKRM